MSQQQQEAAGPARYTFTYKCRYRGEELLVVAVVDAVEQALRGRQLSHGRDDVRVLHELLAQLVSVQADEVRQQRVLHEGLVRAQLHTGEGCHAVQQQLRRLQKPGSGQVRSRIRQDYLSNIADGQQIVRLVNLEYRSTQHQHHHLLLWLGLIAMENGSDNGKGYGKGKGKGKGKGPLRGTFRRFRRSQSPPASTSFLASKMVSLVLLMSCNIITIRADQKTALEKK